MLGRQAVIDRYHAEAAFCRELAAQAVMAVQSAHHEAAAVKEYQPGHGTAGGHGTVNARAYVPAGTGNCDILDAANRDVLRPGHLQHPGIGLACQKRRQLPGPGARDFRGAIQKGLYLRVERYGVPGETAYANASNPHLAMTRGKHRPASSLRARIRARGRPLWEPSG